MKNGDRVAVGRTSERDGTTTWSGRVVDAGES